MRLWLLSLFVAASTSAQIPQPRMHDMLLAAQPAAAAATATPPAGYSVWYDIGQISASVGDKLSSITDESTNGWHAVNSTASTQAYYTNNVSAIGGKPWLRFTELAGYTNAAIAKTQTNAIFAVAYFGSISGTYSVLCDSTNTSRNALYVQAGASPNVVNVNNGSGVGVNTMAVPSKFLLFEVILAANPNTTYVRTNGVLMGSSSAQSGHIEGLTIGARYNAAAGYFFNGGFAEMLIYNTQDKAFDLAAVRTYFTTKYGAYSTW